MRELTRVLDPSHEASIRLALEAAGIKAVFMTAPYTIGERWRGESCYVVHDGDFERAAAIVGGLQRTDWEVGVRSRPFTIVRWIVLLILALMVLATLWLHRNG